MTNMLFILALAGSLSALAGCGGVSAPSPALSGIEVSFKVDPRIARGLYMGDLWISPPYLRVGEGEQVTVEARAYALDTAGQRTTISPAWMSADPGMVTVTPTEGNEVSITVKRAGESSLRITCPGVFKELLISAEYRAGVIQVQISQTR